MIIVKKIKALVLFSGGLDSRLTIKILQEQGLDVEALYIKLPFGTGCCNEFSCVFNFSQLSGVKLHTIDCTKSKLFKDYLKIIKNPKYSRGAGFNPCKDCKIFLFKLGKKFAKEINAEIIATGEVVGQRPMSQMKRDLLLDEKEAGLENKILRPLSAKLLPQTIYEEKGLIERAKLLDISGRRRDLQIRLAKKYGIKYPNPGGGCLLCEKLLKKRFEILLGRGLKENQAQLINLGRHFLIGDSWIILGRNHQENNFLKVINGGRFIEPNFIGPSARIYGKIKKHEIMNLIMTYSKQGGVKEKDYWEKYKI